MRIKNQRLHIFTSRTQKEIESWEQAQEGRAFYVNTKIYNYFCVMASIKKAFQKMWEMSIDNIQTINELWIDLGMDSA